jgi:tRNA (guanine-N(7)-)-methyltransferase subunit TRM82
MCWTLTPPHFLCRFISAIHIPRDPVAHDVLISGGGDPVLKVWEWRTGRRLYDVAIEEAVRPFIAVRRARHKRGYDSDGERKPPSRRWLARQRRRQAKATATTVATTLSEDTGTVPEAAEMVGVEAEAETEAEVEEDEEDEGDESGDDEVDMGAVPATPSGEPEDPPAPVLVVQKIETSKIDERLVLVFSAVGCVSHLEWAYLPLPRIKNHLTSLSATALFWFELPPVPAAVSEGLLVVHAHDFGRPIVTFVPVAGSHDLILVSLDAHWNDEVPSPDVPSHVRLIRLGLDSVRRTLASTTLFSS